MEDHVVTDVFIEDDCRIVIQFNDGDDHYVDLEFMLDQWFRRKMDNVVEQVRHHNVNAGCQIMMSDDFIREVYLDGDVVVVKTKRGNNHKLPLNVVSIKGNNNLVVTYYNDKIPTMSTLLDEENGDL